MIWYLRWEHQALKRWNSSRQVEVQLTLSKSSIMQLSNTRKTLTRLMKSNVALIGFRKLMKEKTSILEKCKQEKNLCNQWTMKENRDLPCKSNSKSVKRWKRNRNEELFHWQGFHCKRTYTLFKKIYTKITILNLLRSSKTDKSFLNSLRRTELSSLKKIRSVISKWNKVKREPNQLLITTGTPMVNPSMISTMKRSRTCTQEPVAKKKKLRNSKKKKPNFLKSLWKPNKMSKKLRLICRKRSKRAL